jgi:thioredoxin 2
MSSIVACPSCGTRNRVPTASTGRPRCASCQVDLPWLVDATDADFDAAVDTARLVLVDLWAPWCGPCRMVAPAVERASREHAGRLKAVKVNVDESPGISNRFRAQSIPMLVLLRDGQVVDTQIGALPEQQLLAWVARHLDTAG